MPRTKTKKTPQELLSELSKEYPGAVKMGSDPALKITKVPTGILAFDRLTGGGVAEQRIHEFFGPESSLKSYTAAKAVIAFLEKYPEMRAMWIDAEGSFDPVWMEFIGMDLDRVDVVKTENGESATRFLEVGAASRGYVICVVDSVAALMPKRESEYNPEDGEKAMGSAGKMNSAMMRRVTRFLHHGVTVILINQLREKIGGIIFGETAKPSGGRAIAHYAGQRIEFKHGETLKEEREIVVGVEGKRGKRKQIVGQVINLRVEKDKCGPRRGSTGFIPWYSDEGKIDEIESLMVLGIEDGIVLRNAAQVTFFPGSKKFKETITGWDKAKAHLVEHPKMVTRLSRRISERSEQLGSIATLV